jgi:hyperosmotically inducible periplasmic protein
MKKKTKVSALGALLVGSLAFAGQPAPADGRKKTQESKADSTRAGADNAAANKRDRDDTEPTADQQKNNQSDVDLAAKIRRSIVGDKSLSTYAHNVKIIAESGHVTLKGPVQSEAEKNTVERKASSIAGQANVKNELEVTP